jgi:methyl-accepting chemotaxis protein
MEQVHTSRTETGQALLTMQETVQKVSEIARQIEASGKDIQLLSASSQRIGGIVDVIGTLPIRPICWH